MVEPGPECPGNQSKWAPRPTSGRKTFRKEAVQTGGLWGGFPTAGVSRRGRWVPDEEYTSSQEDAVSEGDNNHQVEKQDARQWE